MLVLTPIGPEGIDLAESWPGGNLTHGPSRVNGSDEHVVAFLFNNI